MARETVRFRYGSAKGDLVVPFDGAIFGLAYNTACGIRSIDVHVRIELEIFQLQGPVAEISDQSAGRTDVGCDLRVDYTLGFGLDGTRCVADHPACVSIGFDRHVASVVGLGDLGLGPIYVDGPVGGRSDESAYVFVASQIGVELAVV